MAPEEPEKYAVLLELLSASHEYEPLLVLDEHIGITHETSDARNARRTFYKHISFAAFPVKIHVFVHGGPHPSNAYVWRITNPLDLAKDSAAQAHAVLNAPTHSSRAMTRDFFYRFATVGTSKMGLRAVLRYLLPDQVSSRSTEEQEIDERFLKFCMASDDSDPTFFLDGRARVAHGTAGCARTCNRVVLCKSAKCSTTTIDASTAQKTTCANAFVASACAQQRRPRP